MPATLADMTNHDEYITAPVRIIDGIARPVRTLSKANAARWFDAHLGARINTVQTRDGVTTWSPPTRTLSKHFKSMWLLDGSTVTLTQMTVEAITADSITLAWRCDDTGDVIHVTTYTVAA